MELSIIIVSWQVKELLKKCLKSIERFAGDLDYEILVVDNASIDGTTTMVKKEFPQIKLIANSKNLGFAAANNQALKIAQGNYLLLLNPDTEILPGSLQKSLDFLKTKSKAGIIGCQILNPDKTRQPSVRRFPGFWPIFLIFLKLPKFFHFKSVDNYLAKNFDYNQTQTVDQVMGAFMLIKKEALAKIGYLEEKFFLWFEEVDFCLRAKEAGYEVYYFAAAQIVHYGGQSFDQQKLVKKQWRFFVSALTYFHKHGWRRKKI